MERIGASSYTIYLYHPLFVAAVLSGIGLLGTLPTSLLFAGAAAAGTVGPIVMELVAARVPFGGFLLEGRSPQPSSAGAAGREQRERALRVA